MMQAIRLCALALLVVETYSYTGYTAYVNGHVDDWILFRGEKAFADGTNSNNKVVIVTATAGDNGGWRFPHTYPPPGTPPNGYDDVPYWQAREVAMIEAVKKIYPTCSPASSINKNGHPIVYQTCGNIVCYFMRIIDGKNDGNGDSKTGSVSLKQLQASNKPISAIDGSTVYTSWSDFHTTLKKIIDDERPTSGLSGTTSWINVPQVDLSVNPDDHPDHHAVSDAVEVIAPTNAAGKTTGLYGKAEYLTYCTNSSSGHTGCAQTGSINSADKLSMHVAYRDKCSSELIAAGQNAYANSVCRDIGRREWDWWGKMSYYTPIYRSCYPSCTV